MSVTTSTGLTMERMSAAGGAIVRGVDFDRIDDDTFEYLRQTFYDYSVLCIRGSTITPEHQLAFGRRFGRVYEHPYVPSIDGYPGIMLIYQVHPITETWHADTTHSAAPPKITMLVAQKIPEIGGDTAFANQYLAYDALSSGLKQTLETLRAVHYGTELAKGAGLTAEQVTHSHRVVLTHPETGRKAIYVNDNYVRHFDGWTEDESKGLLDFLYSNSGRIEFTFRHRWQPGDLVMWDNYAVQHRVVPDHGTAERILHRITIEGDVI
jgi:taurine dioxygenase